MQQSIEVQKYRVRGLADPIRAAKLSQLLGEVPGVVRVDFNAEKGLVRVASAVPIAFSMLQQAVAAHGFNLAPFTQPQDNGVLKLSVSGMHCRSCEITIERKWKEIPGVKKVDVDASSGRARIVYDGRRPDIDAFNAAIVEDGYTVIEAKLPRGSFASSDRSSDRPSALKLLGLFAVVFLLGSLFSRTGLLRPNIALDSSLSFGAVFLLGLVAASSSCIAVAGGVMLSTAARFNVHYQSATRFAAMRPVLLFVAGRLASYAALGAVIGALGRAVSPSPVITGVITIIAALWMLVMGLEMLGRAPRWALRLLPRLPKVISHRVLDAQGKEHPFVPALLGAGTFFLPCGFTQALQLYALTTGSAATSAMLLFAFALGTAPALLALGWASSGLKGKAGKLFLQFSGALVMLLGFWNIQNGFAIAGYPLSFPRLGTDTVSASEATQSIDPNVSFDGREQVMSMSVGYRGYGPNRFTIRSGVPTRWVIEAGETAGCLAVLQSPRLGVQTYLRPGRNEVAFTPREPGNYSFSCSMGMFRGLITVVPNS